MARKHNSREEGSLRFDTRTRTVMAEFKQDDLKEKLKAVREVVPGKKRDELVMVLQYFEYNVEKTIQAYLEDGAKKVLNEWSHTQSNRKGKGKPRERPDPKTKEPSGKTPTVNGSSDTTNDIAGSVEATNTQADSSLGTVEATSTQADSSLANGHIPQDSSDIGDSTTQPAPQPLSSPSATTNATSAHPQPPGHQQQQHHHGERGKGKGHRESHSIHHNAVKQHHQRERTLSERSNASSVYGDNHHNLDKCLKDLQRQTTSLERLKLLLDSEMDRSSKSVRKVFQEIRKGLDERESNILAELAVVKEEANEMVECRSSKAASLKRLVDGAERMKEAELADVRSQIKHFVSERRHDEDVGRTTRFLYDSDHLLQEVKHFGEVIHITKTVSRKVSTASSNHNNNISGESDTHSNGVMADMEDRLEHTLHIQDSPSGKQTATSNGPPNKGSSQDKRLQGPKSPRLSRKATTSTSPPPPLLSLSTSPSTLQQQRPQQQRQRRPDSRRNNNKNIANGNDSKQTMKMLMEISIDL